MLLVVLHQCMHPCQSLVSPQHPLRLQNCRTRRRCQAWHLCSRPTYVHGRVSVSGRMTRGLRSLTNFGRHLPPVIPHATRCQLPCSSRVLSNDRSDRCNAFVVAYADRPEGVFEPGVCRDQHFRYDQQREQSIKEDGKHRLERLIEYCARMWSKNV